MLTRSCASSRSSSIAPIRHDSSRAAQSYVLPARVGAVGLGAGNVGTGQGERKGAWGQGKEKRRAGRGRAGRSGERVGAGQGEGSVHVRVGMTQRPSAMEAVR